MIQDSKGSSLITHQKEDHFTDLSMPFATTVVEDYGQNKS